MSRTIDKLFSERIAPMTVATIAGVFNLAVGAQWWAAWLMAGAAMGTTWLLIRAGR